MKNKAVYWLGIGLTGLTIAFLLLDALMKVAGAQVSIDATTQLGFTVPTVRVLGVLLLVTTCLYAVPASSVLGAVILTGYLGGTIAIHLRQGNPLASHVLFGVYLGLMAWAGLWLRSPALRSLLPLKVMN